MILGLDVITKHKMFWINSDITFKVVLIDKSCGVIKETSTGQKKEFIVIDDIDFLAEWNGAQWKVKWKWKPNSGGAKECLALRKFVNDGDKEEFDMEIQSWIDEDVLVAYDEIKHGPIGRYLPLMSVRQEKGNITKIRPVFDYR